MSNIDLVATGNSPGFNTVAAVRYRRWRNIKDSATRYLVAVGGVSVIFVLVIIAVFLLYVVVPLFRPAHIKLITDYPAPGGSGAVTLFYGLEEKHEIGVRATGEGDIYFFRTRDGRIISENHLYANNPARISAFAAGDPAQGLLTFAASDGTALLVRHLYRTTFPGGVRVITPYLEFPLGEKPVPISKSGIPIKLITAQSDDAQTTVVAQTENSQILIVSFTKEASFLGDEGSLVRQDAIITSSNNVTHLAMDVDQRELYIADGKGFISYFDISDKASPRLIQRVHAVPESVRITSLQFLSGGISILVGDTRGVVTQWFPVRDEENNYTLDNIRHFDAQHAPITSIAPEYYRKGFIAVDNEGYVGLYHTTAGRMLKLEQTGAQSLDFAAVSPRADAMLLEDGTNNQVQFWRVENKHPEVSWRGLWGKVWYESRSRPEYIWQSSSASSDFEPKFSLTPLAFGTLKASFYAMLFAIPLAILGAIYTAYFMQARMRSLVKPTIEIMAALPTVILGFLAGLWLAPFMEKNLPGILLIFLLIPLSTLVAAWIWHRLPARFRQRIPEGWEAAILVPVIIIAGITAILLSQPVEDMFFGGNMPMWLTNVMGIKYEQRNSLVVGIVMGFAVIPTIFSISEDAIYGVPKHLTTGSLALGATPWQTMLYVILLTASPGIFSAVMIGLGRAVGETMIVVMATGNTPITDLNIFQGFRALSANIAVEMPESAVGSTHYRVLFLAGLVLFIATFLFNTVAEIVRQRLRAKYSNL
jgi:phosphate transport system permease protein